MYCQKKSLYNKYAWFTKNQKEKGKNSKDDDEDDDVEEDDEPSIQDKCDKATAAAKTK